MPHQPRLRRAATRTALGLLLGGAACGYSSPSSSSGGLALNVTSATTGAHPDPDGYSLTVDGGSPQTLAANGTLRLQQLTAAQHVLTLGGLAANCAVTTANPLQVDLSVTYPTQNVGFQVSCP